MICVSSLRTITIARSLATDRQTEEHLVSIIRIIQISGGGRGGGPGGRGGFEQRGGGGGYDDRRNHHSDYHGGNFFLLLRINKVLVRG